MEPKLAELIQYAFYGLISIVATYTASTIGQMKKSVDTLNTQVATVIEKSTWHEKVLDKHDSRLTTLEKK